MSRARDLSKLGNPGVFSVSTDNNVGVNSTAPVEKLNVVGVVSATSFYGDGSKLEGVSSAGLGTAVVDDSPYGGEQIYYTNKALNITGNLTVDVPDSAEVAYTQYQEIVVDSGADFIVGDGDDFIPDILGIGSDVQQPGLLAGGGGRVRADNFSDKSGTGAPTFSSGVVVTGVATATSFDGNLTGDVTGNVTGNADTATTATNAQGLTGTPDITVGDITANNISIGGTLTYEDVTNIDSIGIVTARSGIEVAGIVTAKAGAAVTYYGDGSQLTNIKQHNVEVISATTSLDSNNDIILNLDLTQGSEFSYTVPTGGRIGIVSFTNVTAETGKPSVSIVELKVTQNAVGSANTTIFYQIGTINTIVGYENGSAVSPVTGKGINVKSTNELVLSTFGNSEHVFRYKIYYDGGTNTSSSSYDIIGESLTDSGTEFGGEGAGVIAVSHYGTPGISAYKWTNTGFGVKYSDPVTFEYADGDGIAFSPLGDYVAIPDTSSGFHMYEWTTAGFGRKVSNPSQSIGSGYDVEFSPNGSDFAVSTSSPPYVYVFNFIDGNFSAPYNNPSLNPTGVGRGVVFSPSNDDIAVSHASSPFITVWPWVAGAGGATGGFGAKYSDPSLTNAGGSRKVRFSPSGNDIAWASDKPGGLGPGVFAAPWTHNASGATNGGFGTVYNNPSTAVANDAWEVDFHPSGNDIIVSHNDSPGITAYKWTHNSSGGANGGFGVKYDNPTVLPINPPTFNSAFGVRFSPKGNYVAVASDLSPHIHVYPWTSGTGGSDGGFGTKVANPAVPIPTAGRAVAWHPEQR